MRRGTQQGYREYLKRLTQAEGTEASDVEALRRMDRKRPKNLRNEERANPQNAEAEMTWLIDGRTALAYKSEQPLDMETGAIRGGHHEPWGSGRHGVESTRRWRKPAWQSPSRWCKER